MVGIFNKYHQLHHPLRIYDSLFQEGSLVVVFEPVAAEQQVFGDMVFDLGFNGYKFSFRILFDLQINSTKMGVVHRWVRRDCWVKN